MATETTNYNLTKPEEDDLYSISDFNDNMDIIDAAIAETSAEIDDVDSTLEQLMEYVGTPENEGDTLFNNMGTSSTKFYVPSDTLQHTMEDSDGVLLTYTTNGNIPYLARFTAKYNGTVRIDVDMESSYNGAIYSYFWCYGNNWSCPSGSLAASNMLNSYAGDDNPFASQQAATSYGRKSYSFTVPMTAGHRFDIVAGGTVTWYSAKVYYDLVALEDMVELS